MAMVCPQCSGSFEQHLDCPACGVRLVYQVRQGSEDQWQQTPWGRIVVGLLLAQGLAHGLQMFITGWLQASDEVPGQGMWTSSWGILLLFSLQGISLLIGGTITGAGQVRGLLYGSFVGLVNGLIFLMLNLGRGEIQNEVAFYSQPILHLAFGAMGGLIGTLIWRPLPTLRLEPSSGSAKLRVSNGPLMFAGPIHWIRVLVGIIVAVAGVAFSPTILAFILEMFQGMIALQSTFQARLVTWEISAVAVLVGAGLAGATTPNGPKQGLVVGLGAGVLLIGISLGNPNAAFQASEFLVAALVGLTLAGGWFGSQLFPPLGGGSRRKRIAAS